MDGIRFWFKKSTVGGSSTKLGLGGGQSYDHLQLQQTYTGGGQSEITAFNSNILIATNSSEKNITLQSTNDITLANSVYPFIKCEENSSSDQSVTLYYGQTGSTPYANPKLETTSTGINVTGAITVNGSALSITPTNSDVQVVYTVTANGSSAYRFAGNGVVSTADNPDLYLIRGQKYRFINNSGGSHPFQIRESSGGSAYSTGVTNNGASSGNIDFAPVFNSPGQLVYQCTSHGAMVGNIYISDGEYNTKPNNPVFMAYRTSNYSVTGSATALVFNEEKIDVGNNYDTSNGRFTAPVTGLYEFAYASIASNVQTVYRYDLRINGSIPYGGLRQELRIDQSNVTQYGTNGEFCLYINMTAGQYAQVYVHADSNVSSVYGDTSYGYTYFRGRLIG